MTKVIILLVVNGIDSTELKGLDGIKSLPRVKHVNIKKYSIFRNRMILYKVKM